MQRSVIRWIPAPGGNRRPAGNRQRPDHRRANRLLTAHQHTSPLRGPVTPRPHDVGVAEWRHRSPSRSISRDVGVAHRRPHVTSSPMSPMSGHPSGDGCIEGRYLTELQLRAWPVRSGAPVCRYTGVLTCSAAVRRERSSERQPWRRYSLFRLQSRDSPKGSVLPHRSKRIGTSIRILAAGALGPAPMPTPTLRPIFWVIWYPIPKLKVPKS